MHIYTRVLAAVLDVLWFSCFLLSVEFRWFSLLFQMFTIIGVGPPTVLYEHVTWYLRANDICKVLHYYKSVLHRGPFATDACCCIIMSYAVHVDHTSCLVSCMFTVILCCNVCIIQLLLCLLNCILWSFVSLDMKLDHLLWMHLLFLVLDGMGL